MLPAGHTADGATGIDGSRPNRCRMEANANMVAVNPSWVGKQLNEPPGGYYSARRGTYRIVGCIDAAPEHALL